MRSRSRPQRPRTGSPNAVRSAGTGQRRSTKCRRGGPVAAQRSSGLPRRQGGSPLGADGRGCQAAGGAERSAAGTRRTMAPAREGRGEWRGRRCTKPAGSDAAARPRRLQRRPPTDEISGTNTQNKSSRRPTKHAAWKRKHRARISKGGAEPWGSGKGRQRPCPSAEGKDAGGVTGLEQRNALARRLPTA